MGFHRRQWEREHSPPMRRGIDARARGAQVLRAAKHQRDRARLAREIADLDDQAALAERAACRRAAGMLRLKMCELEIAYQALLTGGPDHDAA